MARTEGQKLTLLYVKDYLERNSHQEHPVSAQELISFLEGKGITCDRRTIYANVRALQDFGMDIVNLKGPKGGYYVASGTFQTPELKLLIDAVQSARFLTQKKSRELTKKLMGQCNRYDESLLGRQVVVQGRAKSMNESIYYNIDAIQEAIVNNRKITFQYFDWDISHKQSFRPGPYEASPYALCMDSENYYLLAHSDRHGVTHYRVDRMLRIAMLEEKRTPCPELSGEALKRYGQKMFQMFSGETERVKLRMVNRFAGIVFDRFGEDTMLIPDGDDHFVFTADVAVSPMFLSWVMGFGKDAEIMFPERVRMACSDLCREILNQYLDKQYGQGDQGLEE